MLIFDRENWRRHRLWAWIVVLLSLSAMIWYATASFLTSHWVGGGSLPGFTFGLVGGLICLFEFLLWPRKKLRIWRIGRVQTWMKLHIWLGLLSLPILILHSGFRWGGSLSTVVMVLFLAVIASGVWGLALQQFLPTKMLLDVQAETIHSQIPRILSQFREEGGRLVQATCGNAAEELAGTAAAAEDEDADSTSTPYLVVGAVRSAGRIRGKVLQTRMVGNAVAASEPLRYFFESTVAPFLTPEGFATSPLRHQDRSANLFADLRTKIDPQAEGTILALENFCSQRRQLVEQLRITNWLHNWLLIHLPLSMALIVLMFIHAFVALKYL